MNKEFNQNIRQNDCKNPLSTMDASIDYQPAIILIYKVLQEQSKE